MSGAAATNREQKARRPRPIAEEPSDRDGSEPLHRHLEGTWKTWLQPGVLHDESPIDATGESMTEGRHLKLEYRGRAAGDDVTGFVLIGPGTSDMAVAWIDTWHTGGAIYLGSGKVVDGGITVPFEWEAEGETWIWTSDYRLEDGSLVIRHYNEGGALERYLGAEAILVPG